MLNKLKITLHYLLPKQALTRAAGWFANKEAGFLTRWTISGFIKFYNVNMQEAKKQSIYDYPTFNDFFTRPLNDKARPIDEDDNTLILPADGTISQLGNVEQGRLIQAKGHDFSLEALLACDKEMTALFQDGLFATTYLSPKDYHRIHMPCNGVLREMLYVPGDLFSVNPLTAENVPNLFARNERLICLFDTQCGPMAQILVGATIVGSIETVWAGTVTPERQGILQRWIYPGIGINAVKLAKGEEMGRFKLGSTVINLFTQDSIILNEKLKPKSITRMGQPFAQNAHLLSMDDDYDDEELEEQ